MTSFIDDIQSIIFYLILNESVHLDMGGLYGLGLYCRDEQGDEEVLHSRKISG
jgi:hypothetical protein